MSDKKTTDFEKNIVSEIREMRFIFQDFKIMIENYLRNK